MRVANIFFTYLKNIGGGGIIKTFFFYFLIQKELLSDYFNGNDIY